MKQTWILALLFLCKTAWVFAQDGKPTDAPQTQRHRHPNVLFIAVDDLNHWVTHLKRNPQSRTPNIDRLNQSTDQPLFIACGLHKPHLPFAVPRKYYELFPLETIELPPHRLDDLDDIPTAGRKMANPAGDHAEFLKSGRWKAAIQSYLATCAYTDMNIGRLLDALEKSNARENTIIVLWGDHGWSLGEKQHWRKFALWEEPTRTPLIVVAPGTTTAGTVCEHPVDLMSVYPTLCQLAGLPIPDHVQSKSIAPLLKDPQSPWDIPAITTHGRGNHAVRLGQWRYIRYADGIEELYDHSQDEYEWTNLADREQYVVMKSELKKYLPNAEKPSK